MKNIVEPGAILEKVLVTFPDEDFIGLILKFRLKSGILNYFIKFDKDQRKNVLQILSSVSKNVGSNVIYFCETDGGKLIHYEFSNGNNGFFGVEELVKKNIKTNGN